MTEKKREESKEQIVQSPFEEINAGLEELDTNLKTRLKVYPKAKQEINNEFAELCQYYMFGLLEKNYYTPVKHYDRRSESYYSEKYQKDNEISQQKAIKCGLFDEIYDEKILSTNYQSGQNDIQNSYNDLSGKKTDYQTPY